MPRALKDRREAERYGDRPSFFGFDDLLVGLFSISAVAALVCLALVAVQFFGRIGPP